MWDRIWQTWLPMVCLVATLALAVALAGAVFVAPWLAPDGSSAPRLLELFARDVSVRRTALASAAGLTATGLVFFRPARFPKKPAPKEPPSNTVAGA